jgi:excinuclease ABC subunit C
MIDRLAAPHPLPEELPQKIAAAPSEPGVYVMRDDQGSILYVGKARNLRKRLAAYFKPSGHSDSKLDALVRRIADVETILTRTEKEALILESNLIKRHRPRYNVVLKDDKRYPSLRIDPTEAYPAFTIVRKIGEDPGLYFGPFASAHAVRETLQILNKTFKLRQCKKSGFRGRTRPCLHCQMNGCLAPCCRDVPADVYRDQVQEAILFLRGRTQELLRKIRGEMDLAARSQEYEKAARLRDKLFALQRTTEKQIAVTTDFQDRDVFAAAGAEGAVVITHLTVRGGFLTGTRHFGFPETMAGADDLLGLFIRQFYEDRSGVPGEILVSRPLEDAALTEEWLAAPRGQKVRILRPERGEKARLLEMAVHNAETELRNVIARRSAGSELLSRLQQRLRLARYPQRIECVDCSTLMGTDTVAGMVVYIDGRAEPAAYRTYRIRSVELPDDYAAMAEMLHRRLQNAGNETRTFPDLLMVDGGRGQLGVALAVMQDLQLQGAFDVIGIAKKDEGRGETRDKIYLPGRTNPVQFGRDGDLLLFLQRVRDESHRFAIGFHRRRRRTGALTSALDGIRGLGKARRAVLMKRYGSVEAMRAATLAELSGLPGFNRRLAETLKAALEDRRSAPRPLRETPESAAEDQ